jgi:hypothetical protein
LELLAITGTLFWRAGEKFFSPLFVSITETCRNAIAITVDEMPEVI